MRRHIIAIVLAVGVGALMAAPALPWTVYPMGSDAESHYLARMQEAYEGNSWGNPFLNDAKSTAYSPYLSIAEAMLAMPGKILGISAPAMNVVYKILLPATIFLLVYALFLSLYDHRGWAAISAMSVVLGYQVFTLHGLRDLGYGGHQFAMYARPVNPQLSSIVFFAYLIVAHMVSKYYRRRDVLILCALFGLSFYIYFYLWTWLLMFQGVMALLMLRQRHYAWSLRWLGVSCAGLIIGLPFIVQLWKVMHSPLYGPFSAIMGVVRGHGPQMSLLGFVVSAIYLYYFLRTEHERRSYFLFGLLVTAWISINQQVITGITIQDGHYHWYYNVPVFVIALFTLASTPIAEKYRRYALAGGITLAVLSLMSACLIQLSSYRYWTPVARELATYRSAFTWLNRNTPAGTVILTDEMMSEYVPVYTHDDVFWNPYALYYLLPSGRLEITAFTIMRLYGVDQRLASELFSGTIPDGTPYDVSQFFSGPARLSHDSGFLQRYQRFSVADAVATLHRFGVSYMLTNRAAQQPACPATLRCPVVFSGATFDIVQIP